MALGATPDVAAQVAGNARRWWRNSGMLLELRADDPDGPTNWGYPVSVDLNFSNRPVRTRMPGGVAGERATAPPMPISNSQTNRIDARACRAGPV